MYFCTSVFLGVKTIIHNTVWANQSFPDDGSSEAEILKSSKELMLERLKTFRGITATELSQRCDVGSTSINIVIVYNNKVQVDRKDIAWVLVLVGYRRTARFPLSIQRKIGLYHKAYCTQQNKYSKLKVWVGGGQRQGCAAFRARDRQEISRVSFLLGCVLL